MNSLALGKRDVLNLACVGRRESQPYLSPCEASPRRVRQRTRPLVPASRTSSLPGRPRLCQAELDVEVEVEYAWNSSQVKDLGVQGKVKDLGVLPTVYTQDDVFVLAWF